MANDLISRKALVKALIAERDKHPPEMTERYSFGAKVPCRFNQAIRGGIRKALRAIETAPAVPATPKWISVEERLPEDGDSVLVIANGRYGNIKFVNAICMATYSSDEGWIIDNYEEWYGAEVDYWMPLPEPPEEEVRE